VENNRRNNLLDVMHVMKGFLQLQKKNDAVSARAQYSVLIVKRYRPTHVQISTDWHKTG